MSEVTQLLSALSGEANAGEAQAALFPLVYDLAAVEPRAAGVIKLCFFVGLTQEQAAQELGISVSTAKWLWLFARGAFPGDAALLRVR